MLRSSYFRLLPTTIWMTPSCQKIENIQNALGKLEKKVNLFESEEMAIRQQLFSTSKDIDQLFIKSHKHHQQQELQQYQQQESNNAEVITTAKSTQELRQFLIEQQKQFRHFQLQYEPSFLSAAGSRSTTDSSSTSTRSFLDSQEKQQQYLDDGDGNDNFMQENENTGQQQQEQQKWIKEICSATTEFDQFLKPNGETNNNSNNNSNNTNIGNLSSDVVVSFCTFLSDWVNDQPTTPTEDHCFAVRDAFIYIAQFVQDLETCKTWSSCIKKVVNNTRDPKTLTKKHIFGTEKIVSAFAFVSKFATCDKAVELFSDAVVSLTFNDEVCQTLFGAPEIVDAFASVSQYVTSSEASDSWCWSLTLITKIKENQHVFATEKFCDSVCRMYFQLVKVGESVLFWNYWKILHNVTCSTHHHNIQHICNMIVNDNSNNNNNNNSGKNNDDVMPKNQKIFSVDAVRDIMLDSSKYINCNERCYYFCRILISLTASSDEFSGNPKFFCGVPDAPKALANVAAGNNASYFTHSKESLCWATQAIKTMLQAEQTTTAKTDSNKLFSTSPEIRRVVKDLKSIVNDQQKVDGLIDELFSPEAIANASNLKTLQWRNKFESHLNPYKKNVENRNYIATATKVLDEIEDMLE